MNFFIHRFPVALVLLATLLNMSAGVVFGQQNANIKVSGPCTKCADHLLGAAKAIPGVSSASFDAATSMLNVGFDAGTSALDISIELSMAGYNAGDFKADPKAKFPPCCASASRGDMEDEDLGELVDEEETGDWEDADNLEALERLSTRNDSGISDADLEEEADDDSDLEGFEDLDDVAVEDPLDDDSDLY